MLSLRRLETKFIKGIGPTRAELLEKELGIRSAWDLLHHFPTSYVDRSRFYTIRDISATGGEMPHLQLRGRFVSFNVLGEGAKMRLVGLFSDGTATMDVVWFKSIRTIRNMYGPGRDYVLFGKPSSFNGRLQMTHPEVELPEKAEAASPMRGVYPLTERLRKRNIDSRFFHNVIDGLLRATTRRLVDPLPRSIVESQQLMPLDDAIRQLHSPTGASELQRARFRMKFEELFYIQTDMVARTRRRKGLAAGYAMPRVGHWFNTFYKECLPFELTGAQKRVIKEIRADIAGGRQMNRLVQGDVGSGKTLVALNVKLLTGSTRAGERAVIHEQLLDGSLHLLVGTHAVIEDTVEFRNLGFAVIDEQHRFGVAQRARLWKKSTIPPHVLVMTATPIPRTLAMTVYGDLDVSVIDELPPGRKPVETLLRYEKQRLKVYQGVYSQLRQGHQIYIVYPLIEENEKLALKSLEEGYENIRETFREYEVAFVHGRQKAAEKDYQMQRFVSGEAQILVATTVIEVGVNVPNATTMIIENAERFGLSQLHQLRGRVGRGADKSYCILMSKYEIAGETRKRLEIMTSSTDGFVIAEADMQMRGPGDIEGTMQSGMPFDLHIANLATDGQIIAAARRAAETLLDSDPSLSHPDNVLLAKTIREIASRSMDWSRIS